MKLPEIITRKQEIHEEPQNEDLKEALRIAGSKSFATLEPIPQRVSPISKLSPVKSTDFKFRRFASKLTLEDNAVSRSVDRSKTLDNRPISDILHKNGALKIQSRVLIKEKQIAQIQEGIKIMS